MGELLFITGGARSGKSTHAERLARRFEVAGRPVVYVATMRAGDDELRERVERHRARRPATWTTIEETRDLAHALDAAGAESCVLLDCLSLWVTERLLALDEEDPPTDAIDALEREIDDALDGLVEAVRRREGPVIVVTNEVGAGVVPPYPLGRVYRDLLGRANQRLSHAADRAWLLVAGRALELPSPEDDAPGD